MAKLASDVEAAIQLQQFVYSDYFQGSPRAKQFAAIDNQVKQQSSELQHAAPTLYRDCPTFNAFSAEWLAEHEGIWKASFNANVNSIYENYLLPAFANQRLDNISRADIMKFRANLTKPQGSKAHL